MAEELQNLLDRIRKDGIERAEADAQRMIAEAERQARTVVDEAQQKASELLEQARAESERFAQRSESAIAHAARDVILAVGEAITETFQAILARKVGEAMKGDRLIELIRETLRAYGSAEQPGNLAVLLGESECERIQAQLMADLADAIRQGLTIRGTRQIRSGFRVEVKDSGVQHDFTGEALTAAIGELLRPQLAAIVNGTLSNLETSAAS